MSDNLFTCRGSSDFLSKYVRSRFKMRGSLDFSLAAAPRTWPVIIVRCEGAPRLVIKLVGTFRRFLKVVSRWHFLSQQGLPVPRLLGWTISSRLTPLRSYLLVQEYIAGRKPLAEERDIERLARALAALHSVSGTTRRILNPSLKRGGYFKRQPYIRFRLRQTVLRLGALEEQLGPTRGQQLVRAFHESAMPMWHRSRNEMVHGDVKPSHYVLTGQSATILDLDEAHFGNFACDLVSALHILCEDEEHKKRRFLAVYFRSVCGVAESDFAIFEPFYHADFHLRAAAHALRQLLEQRIDPKVFADLFGQQLDCCLAALTRKIGN